MRRQLSVNDTVCVNVGKVSSRLSKANAPEIGDQEAAPHGPNKSSICLSGQPHNLRHLTTSCPGLDEEGISVRQSKKSALVASPINLHMRPRLWFGGCFLHATALAGEGVSSSPRRESLNKVGRGSIACNIKSRLFMILSD